jgi:hypothetical protein
MRLIMSLEAYRSRLRALEFAARKLATSTECSGTKEPELIQIAVHFHPAEGTSAQEAASMSALRKSKYQSGSPLLAADSTDRRNT